MDSPADLPRIHALIGSRSVDRSQYGVLGYCPDDHGRIVGIDLNGMFCACLFGEPGAGKSYCLGTIIEMAGTRLPGLNHLPRPILTVVVHYAASEIYPPECASLIHPQDGVADLSELAQRYRAAAGQVTDCVLLAPADRVERRRQEFPGLPCQALRFSASELAAADWRILMGATGEEDALYAHVVNRLLRQAREQVSIAWLRERIDAAGLHPDQRDKAQIRLSFAEDYIHQGPPLRTVLRPGRLVIVDLRDEYLQRHEAFALALVLLHVVAAADEAGRPFPKLVVLDEAHTYMQHPDMVLCLTETIREMRHRACSVLIASQDPPSIPTSIIELSTMIALMRMSSPRWLQHIAQVKPAFSHVTPAHLGSLAPGEAYIWSSLASDPIYGQIPQRIRIRPRATRHGGATRLAVDPSP